MAICTCSRNASIPQCIRRLDKHLSPTESKPTTPFKKTYMLPLAKFRVLRFNSQRRQRVPQATVQRVTTHQPTQRMKPNCVQRVAKQPPPCLLRPRHSNTTGAKEPTVFPNGTIIRKRFFIKGKFHKGEVILHDPVNQYYRIKYRVNGSEEVDQKQLHRHHKRTQ